MNSYDCDLVDDRSLNILGNVSRIGGKNNLKFKSS